MQSKVVRESLCFEVEIRFHRSPNKEMLKYILCMEIQLVQWIASFFIYLILI
jgi:hypothetical protein